MSGRYLEDRPTHRNKHALNGAFNIDGFPSPRIEELQLLFLDYRQSGISSANLRRPETFMGWVLFRTECLAAGW
jgi:hypothetical protein